MCSQLKKQRTAAATQRGSALVMAVVVVSFVSAVCLGLLTLNNAVIARQESVVEQRRAFYVAEGPAWPRVCTV